MALIEVETEINADIQTCFDLARDVDFYQESIKNSKEIPIDGKISGLVDLNDHIVWEAKHLGFVRHLTLKVTEFNNPSLFVDEMIDGEYKSYRHEHVFKKNGNKSIMIDKFYFESPYGIIGKLVDWVFLKKYLTKMLKKRNKILKDKVENNLN